MSILLLQQNVSAGVSPGATAADNVIATMLLPANAFEIAGRGIHIEVQGSFAANGNNKLLKIIFGPASATLGSTVGAGGALVVSSGTIATNGGGWRLVADVFKYGLPGSNTQLCSGYAVFGPAAQAAGVVALTAPILATATETAAIFLAVTANCTTATTDVVLNLFNVIGLQ